MEITQKEEEKKYANDINEGDGGDVANAQSGEVEVCMNKQESGDGENEGSSEESELNEIASSDEVSEERHGSETGEGESRNNRDGDDEEKHSDMQGFSDEELDDGW